MNHSTGQGANPNIFLKTITPPFSTPLMIDIIKQKIELATIAAQNTSISFFIITSTLEFKFGQNSTSSCVDKPLFRKAPKTLPPAYKAEQFAAKARSLLFARSHTLSLTHALLAVTEKWGQEIAYEPALTGFDFCGDRHTWFKGHTALLGEDRRVSERNARHISGFAIDALSAPLVGGGIGGLASPGTGVTCSGWKRVTADPIDCAIYQSSLRKPICSSRIYIAICLYVC
jgi:hypothetical protein